MDIERFYVSFKSDVSETKRELQSYASLFCANHGYYVDDLRLFFDDAGLMPGIRVTLQPTLRYDEHARVELETSLERDLNNIIFDQVYNARYKINAEESKRVRSIPQITECLPRLVMMSHN